MYSILIMYEKLAKQYPLPIITSKKKNDNFFYKSIKMCSPVPTSRYRLHSYTYVY